jgi:predicted nucleic acid-binding protein
LLVQDAGHAFATKELHRDPAVIVWWGTHVECVSALVRREREGTLRGANVELAWARLRDLSGEWQEILPSTMLRTRAERALRVHPLRAADALQLAAALTAAEGDPASLDVVTFDGRLKESAVKEGFNVL